MKTKQWKRSKIKHRGDTRKAVIIPLPQMMPKVGRRRRTQLWDRESGGWTDTPHAPAVGSELLRPQTSPSCNAIWTVKLISEGVLGRPCEMRHRTNANSFLNPQGGGDLLYPSLTCMGMGCMEGPAALSEHHPPQSCTCPKSPWKGSCT